MGWLLPLGLFVAGGILALVQVDSLLRREYREQAVTQAVQAEALVEGFLRQRASLMDLLQGALEDGQLSGNAPVRFATFARVLERDAPDLKTLLLLDRDGRVEAVFPETRERQALVGTNLAATPVHDRVLASAVERGRAALSGTVELPLAGAGVLIVSPILADGDVHGFVAATLSYDAAFSGALAGQLRGPFAYRLRDAGSAVIAGATGYPPAPASEVQRQVAVGGAPPLVVEVAVPRWQPLAPRLLTAGFGGMLLVLVAALVLRERAQSRRLHQRSVQLEELSRNLLEVNLRLEEHARQLTDANRAKSRFLANVSHELRTPLNAIVGYSALARDGIYGTLPGELHDIHERIGTASHHLLELVNDILDLSRIESGRMAVEPERISLPTLIDSVTAVVGPMVSAKALELRVLIDDDLPPLETDPRHLRQVLLNLVTNAVKYTDAGRITIHARRAETSDRVAIAVADTGRGIAPADQARIFEEFEQVRPRARGDSLERGTGLGLAIARKLARVIGGEISVHSALARGSIFTIDLPVTAPWAGEREMHTPPRVQRVELVEATGRAAREDAPVT